MTEKSFLESYRVPDLLALRAISPTTGRANGSFRTVRSLPDNEPESLYCYRQSGGMPDTILTIKPDDQSGNWLRVGGLVHYATVDPTAPPFFRGIIWVNTNNGNVWVNASGTESWVLLQGIIGGGGS